MTYHITLTQAQYDMLYKALTDAAIDATMLADYTTSDDLHTRCERNIKTAEDVRAVISRQADKQQRAAADAPWYP